MTATTSRPRGSHHPVFARLWPRVAGQLDDLGVGEHRRRLLAGLEGRVLEIGAGDGRNFEHYPRSVDEVVAVEPEPYLQERARQAARRAPVPITVLVGAAEALPVADGEFDVAVTSLVLCSVGDPGAALAEIRRVLHPAGELRFFEHVAAGGGAQRQFQRVLDATIWPRIGGGCHTGRDTTGAIAASGFEIEAIESFRFPDGGMPTPTSPHVLGRARRG